MRHKTAACNRHDRNLRRAPRQATVAIYRATPCPCGPPLAGPRQAALRNLQTVRLVLKPGGMCTLFPGGQWQEIAHSTIAAWSARKRVRHRVGDLVFVRTTCTKNRPDGARLAVTLNMLS